MYCNHCNNVLLQGAKFCGKCGTKVVTERRCANCNSLLSHDDTFCTECGSKYGEIATINSNPLELPKFDEFGFEILPELSDLTMPDFSQLDDVTEMPDFDALDNPPVFSDFKVSSMDKPIILPIPNGITEINIDNVTEDLKDKGYTSIIIPEGVTEIGYYAFRRWEKLERVVIANSVKEINGTAFSYCKSLREVIIPNRETRVQSQAFFRCHESLVIHCPSGSYAENIALEKWIKFKLTDRKRYEADKSSKPRPVDNGRFCGTACYNVARNKQNGHEYGGWYYDIFFDNIGFCDLVRFDEDNVDAIEFLWRDELKKPHWCDIILQTNRFGVFVFIESNILWYSHKGVLVKNIEMNKLLPNLQNKIKKDLKEWRESFEYECRLFSSVWVYGHIVYFTTNFDYDNGIIYRYDLQVDEIRHFKITKPRNLESCTIAKITGDERYVSFSIDDDSNTRLLDTFTESVYKMNAIYIEFETKRCFYNIDSYIGKNDVPLFTPDGFQNVWLSKDLMSSINGVENGEHIGGFYSDHIFTGEAFYGFRYGHTKKYRMEEDHYYNLYKVTENNWSYMNAGSRGGIEELSIQGNYCYFDTTSGIRAKLDGSGMATGWTGKTGGKKDYGSLMETEKVFRRLYLQEVEFDI